MALCKLIVIQRLYFVTLAIAQFVPFWYSTRLVYWNTEYVDTWNDRVSGHRLTENLGMVCCDDVVTRVWRLTPPSFPRLLYVIYEASRAWVSWILLLVSPAILIAWLFTCTVCTARLHARINLHGELPWRLFNAIFNVNRLPYRRANVYLHRYVPFRLLRITANAKQTRNRLERISTRSAYMKHRSSIQWIMQCCCSYVYFNLLYNRSGCRIVRIFERTMRREKNHYPSFSREKFIREE